MEGTRGTGRHLDLWVWGTRRAQPGLLVIPQDRVVQLLQDKT